MTDEWDSMYVKLPADMAEAARTVIRSLFFLQPLTGETPVTEPEGSVTDKDGARMEWGPCLPPSPPEPQDPMWGAQGQAAMHEASERIAAIRRRQQAEHSYYCEHDSITGEKISPTEAGPPSSPSSSESDPRP